MHLLAYTPAFVLFIALCILHIEANLEAYKPAKGIPNLCNMKKHLNEAVLSVRVCKLNDEILVGRTFCFDLFGQNGCLHQPWADTGTKQKGGGENEEKTEEVKLDQNPLRRAL